MATAQEMVDKIETAITELVDNNVQSYTVEGVTYGLLDLDKLQRLQDYYRRLAARSKRSGKSRRKVAAFRRPS